MCSKMPSNPSSRSRCLVIADDYYKTVTVDYRGGPRFPHLVRVEGKPDLLDDLIKPRAETEVAGGVFPLPKSYQHIMMRR